ncbi:hypothetical protein Trydic_g9589 [Trypoxylus dichotomus]
MYYIILIANLLARALALYSSSSNVVELNALNFDTLVIKAEEVWLVEFYAPWCGHCQQLVPEYKKVADALKNIVKVGAVNVDEQNDLGERFDITGFPTIKIFGTNKNKPEDYAGPRTAQGLVDSAFNTIRNKVYTKLGIKSSKQSEGSPADVIELTDDNFDKVVLQSKEMWLVEFYAPWCGHCKNLAPHWAKAATKLKGKVNLGALDATVHKIKANQYGIQGFPTIKYFALGKKSVNTALNYDGGRSADDIVNWALEKFLHNIPAPEAMQILDAASFREVCEEKVLCVISVLPHILDCQSKCRRNYLDLLKKMGEKYKEKMWGWVWAEAGSQLELESVLDMGGFGYPTMAVLNSRKLKYSMFRGSFSEVGINEFLRDLSYGKGGSMTLKGGKLPQIATVNAWDGNDGEFPQEEDIDSSDVDLDEKENAEQVKKEEL